jgi:hypothetical protein
MRPKYSFDPQRPRRMPNVHVEARPKGRPEGSAIDDYVGEEHADHVLAPSKHSRRQSTGPGRMDTPRGRACAAPDRQKETGPLAGGVSVTFLAEPGSKRFVCGGRWRALSVLVDLADSAQAIADPKDAAESAGLRYVSDARPGIHRKKAGKDSRIAGQTGRSSPSLTC